MPTTMMTSKDRMMYLKNLAETHNKNDLLIKQATDQRAQRWEYHNQLETAMAAAAPKYSYKYNDLNRVLTQLWCAYWTEYHNTILDRSQEKVRRDIEGFLEEFNRLLD